MLFSAQQRAACLNLFIDQHDAGATVSGGQCGRKPGRTGADNEHIAMMVAFFVAIFRLVSFRRFPQTGHTADKITVDIPPVIRPHEGLVIKAGREKAVQPIVDRAKVPPHTRPACNADSFQALVYRNGSCDETRFIFPAGKLYDGIGFLNTRAHDTARAMVFETASDESDPIGY